MNSHRKKMQIFNEKTKNQTWGNGIEREGGLDQSQCWFGRARLKQNKPEAIAGKGSGWI